ncbi:hypothetical protein [Lysinibacillus sp.]|uniref:hypothetical protein n=1 Tax=Lysinibacillus sp. TaxID=1869345 RepID=UPI0028A282CC|nr:hypothetical protein [Lysinibacillus sp.]
MKKSEDLLVKFLIALAGLTIGVVVVLTIIAFQIGVEELEKPNRIAIISGLLSMVGGIAGAFGAYFIARMQMTKQLDLQYKKEEEKMIKEIKINNYLKALENGDALLQSLSKLHRLLLESLIDISADDQSFIKYEKNINTQLQEIKALSTKLNIYEVFYDQNALFHFKNINKNINSMNTEVLEKWLGYCLNKEDLRKSINNLESTSKEFAKMIEKPRTHVIKILSITQLYLKKATN